MEWGILAVPFLIAAVAFWYRTKIGRQLALMTATPTSKAAEVARLPAGAVVAVQGTLRCQQPLEAEFSKQKCAHFVAEITRVDVPRRDSISRSVIVYSNTKFVPCGVEDDSGRVALNLDGAKVEGEQLVNRSGRPPQGAIGPVLSVASGSGADLTYTESILAVDIPIYVLGEVQLDHSVGKPGEGSTNKDFLVSRKSEEQRSKQLRSLRAWLLFGGLALVAFGVIASVFVAFAMFVFSKVNLSGPA